MKKIFLSMILFFVAFFSLFSIDFSTGVGLKITPYTEQIEISAERYKSAYVSYDWVDWSAYAFFDAQYVEFDIGYYRALYGSYSQSSFGAPLDLETQYGDLNISYLDLSLMLKYPIKIKTGAIIPLIGFSYRINLTSDYGYTSYKGDVPKKDWNQMWIKTGVNYDHNITSKIFARTVFTLCFPIKTPAWGEKCQDLYDIFAPSIPGVKTTFGGIGCELSIALGYRINN